MPVLDKQICSNITLMQHVLSCLLALCVPDCVNGNCTTPGFCSCDAGWLGETCEDGNVFLFSVCTCSDSVLPFIQISMSVLLETAYVDTTAPTLLGAITAHAGVDLNWITISTTAVVLRYLGLMLLINKHEPRGQSQLVCKSIKS